MRDFFAGLRLLLSYVDLERLNLGALAHQAIQKEFIPRLKKKLKQARTDTDKERFRALIDEYEQYSDPSNPKSRIYTRTASGIVRQLAARSRMSDEDMEDLMQDLAMDFFKPLQASGNDLGDVLLRLREEEGPLALNRLWMNTVDLRTKYRIREIQRKHKERTFDMKETDEGDVLDPMSRIPAPSMVDEKDVRQILVDLPNYMKKNLRHPEQVKFFNLWFKLAQQKGADRVDIKNDVIKPLIAKGAKSAPSTMTWWWESIRKLIVQFFQDELGDAAVPAIRHLLNASIGERIAHQVYRQRLAAWMLGGILRGTLVG